MTPFFGWLPPDDRTHAQQINTLIALHEMPRFLITGAKGDDPKKVCLWELWKHPLTVKAIGFEYPGTHQLTGSCVGAGGGNVLFTVMAVEVIRKGDPEEICVPFWLLPYGRSRFYLGERTPGEGSTGATFAKAAREDGVLPATLAGLPAFENNDGLQWGAGVERSWSDGDAQQTMALLPESRKHPVRTTAECRSADDVREAIRNYYPCTIASSWGGGMQCRTEGDPPVLVNKRQGQWNHQMSVQAWWDHPSLGEIFWVQNQWGLETHGRDPAGGPGGGFWVKKADVDWICRNGEVFAFSQFDGFPAQTLSWIF